MKVARHRHRQALSLDFNTLVFVTANYNLSAMAMTAGFVHIVYFWLKDGITAQQEEEFHQGVHKLMEIDLIQQGLVGPPAMTPRDVVDNSYNYAIMAVFANKADHDLYQTHPDHDLFIANHKHLWDRVQVYDHLVK